MLFGLLNCKNDKPKDELLERFTAELAKHDLKIDSIDHEGLLSVDIGETDLKISLENLRRNYERDKDTTLITDFVNSILAIGQDIPEWGIAKDSIYYSLFPSDYDFKEVVNEKVTDQFHKVYIYSNIDHNTWVTKKDVSKWKISKEELDKQVVSNINRLMESVTIIYDTIHGKKLGFFSLKDETLKAALLFSSQLKNKVEKDIGWPIYAVIPVRDFSYIFSEKDSKFFMDRLGSTVLKEYKESGYPITKEILKISDGGIEAVGKYED